MTASSARCWAPTSTSSSSRSTRPTSGCGPTASWLTSAHRRQGADLPGRRAVQPVPARGRPRPLPQGRPAGGDAASMPPACRCCRSCPPRSRRRWTWASRSSPARPRKPPRHRPEGRLERHAEAALQPGRPAGHRGRPDAAPAAGGAGAQRGRKSSFDLGRGCPFQCSFCTIINVQGRKSRFRNPDDLEAIVRENYKQGITSFFITDDNMAMHKHWERLLRPADRAQGERRHRYPRSSRSTRGAIASNFIQKARWAGVYRVFIGLENVNPDNLPGRQEAPEQDHRIPQDAGVAPPARRPGPATSWASPATRADRSCATSRSSRTNCRSISSSSSC